MLFPFSIEALFIQLQETCITFMIRTHLIIYAILFVPPTFIHSDYQSVRAPAGRGRSAVISGAVLGAALLVP